MMYMATGLSSSSISRIENTTNFLLISTLLGLFKNVDHEPLVYFASLETMDSLPSIPAITISKSESSGGSICEKSDSGVMSFMAYVSEMARSTIESSSGVSPPSISRNNPTKLMIFERRTSSAVSSSRGIGRSNGFMWWSDASEISKYLPPTASAKNSYSLSGSMTIISTSNMSERKISSLIAYDFPDPDFANVTEL